MLVALNQSKIRCLAWETEKSESPFFCPECHGEVIIKKGYVKEHHYAHKPPSNCQYGSGESQLHYKTKKELYLNLKDHPRCTKCEIERRLDGVRPDVSLFIDKYPVAIEIQRSCVDISEIVKKAEKYTKLGIYLIYIFPEEGPRDIWHEGEARYTCRPNQWEKFLHSIVLPQSEVDFQAA
jgi:competence protein CoiA